MRSFDSLCRTVRGRQRYRRRGAISSDSRPRPRLPAMTGAANGADRHDAYDHRRLTPPPPCPTTVAVSVPNAVVPEP